MSHRRFHIGPGAASLMLLAVILSMSVLSVLALVSAKNDANLSKTSIAVAEEIYFLHDKAERSFMLLDEAVASVISSPNEETYLAKIESLLPDYMSLDGLEVHWTEQTDSGRSMKCAVQLFPSEQYLRIQWIERRLITNLIETELEV